MTTPAQQSTFSQTISALFSIAAAKLNSGTYQVFSPAAKSIAPALRAQQQSPSLTGKFNSALSKQRWPKAHTSRRMQMKAKPRKLNTYSK